MLQCKETKAYHKLLKHHKFWQVVGYLLYTIFIRHFRCCVAKGWCNYVGSKWGGGKEGGDWKALLGIWVWSERHWTTSRHPEAFECIYSQCVVIPTQRSAMLLQKVTAWHYIALVMFRAITIKSDNVSYEPRAITVRSDNSFHKPWAITIKSDNFSPQCWSIMG